MTPVPLVVGYGNGLRSDDGVGWYVAGLVAADLRTNGATVVQAHQLTPELALDISRASVVVFVDAQLGPEPGSFEVRRVPRVDSAAAAAWSHHLDPASLVGLARELYGSAPATFTVGVGIASLDAGEQLSAPVVAALPDIVEAVVALVDAATGPAVVAGGFPDA